MKSSIKAKQPRVIGDIVHTSKISANLDPRSGLLYNPDMVQKLICNSSKA